MHPTPNLHPLLGLDSMSPPDVSAVLANARNLQRAAETGSSQKLLRGKNIGLLCEADTEEDATLFRRAASELGAHVARIRPSLSELSNPVEVRHTAQMLGRLYDAVVCEGVAPALVRQVRNDAGVPVFDGIAEWNHPTIRLAEHLADASTEDQRRYMLQAMLLATLG